MSIIYDTSPEHCAAQEKIPLQHIKKLNKKLFFAVSSLLLSLLFLFLLFFLILHPSKPRFHLRDASLYDFRLSSPPLPRLLNSTIEATVASNNPNAHVGVYYDRLSAYAVYRGQQITAEAELPPFYQGNGDTDILSASLVGVGLPVATSLGYEIVRDQMNGKMVLSIRMDGVMRWKVGSWVSGKYRFDVDCVAVIGYGGGGAAGTMEGAECSTNV